MGVWDGSPHLRHTNMDHVTTSMPRRRKPYLQNPKTPIPDAYRVGSIVWIGEGWGEVLAVSKNHILCAMVAGAEVLGYQIARWDTRNITNRNPTWECIADGFHLHRSAAERHFQQRKAMER